MSINLTSLNVYLLKSISKVPKLQLFAQKCRFFLMRGPFQNFFAHYYQKHSKNKLIVCADESLFPKINITKAVAELKSQSYSACLQLSAEIVGEILAFREGENSNNIHHPHKKSPLINRIAHDPQIVKVIREYFQTEPILYASRLYYTQPRINSEGEINTKYKDAKIVHFDVTDYMDVTVFFYLNDIDFETSPHILYPGTHKQKSLKDLIATRYTEKEAQRRFRKNSITLTGSAGLGFFEDTSCFHIQGLGKKGRAMLSFCYTLQRKADLARYQGNFMI